MSDPDLGGRLISLPNVFNVRDIGGYATPHGQIQRGRLLRAAVLDRLTEAGRARLASIGIRTIVDLRNDDERRERPTALGSLDVTTIGIPIVVDSDSEDNDDLTLEEGYDQIIERSGERLAAVIDSIADRDALPAIVHCTAGKDRTGMVIAFLLALLEVDERTIAADYAASEALLGAPFVARLAEGDPDIERRLNTLMGAPPGVIGRVFGQVRESHGSVADYLFAHGLPADATARLREALIQA